MNTVATETRHQNDAAPDMPTALVSGATNMIEETAGFGFFMACKGLDAAAALLACRSPDEFVRTQARLAGEFANAWTDESTRLMSVYLRSLAGQRTEGGIEDTEAGKTEERLAA